MTVDRSMEQQMRRTYVEFKRARENATAAANLEQRAKAGLKHVAEILGIPQVSRPTQSDSSPLPLCSPLDCACFS